IDTLLSEIKVGNFMYMIVNKYPSQIAKKIANWLSSDVQGYIANRTFTWDQIKLNETSMVELAKLIENNSVSSTSAKIILKEILSSDDKPSEIANRLKLIQLSGSDDLIPIIKKVISDNPDAVTDLLSGQEKVIGYLVGQVMKLSQGKADPEISNKLIKQELNL
ncbi:MAG TPA: hypothetical protein VMV24_00205, partial [Candidatus Dormibacteraeota bacterium]|nr:hypothetical protein [Candidatus Dormibacteraeota bacterium]